MENKSVLHSRFSFFLWGICLFATTLYTFINWRMYSTLQLPGFDAARYGQKAWLYGNFISGPITIRVFHPSPALSDHFEPIYFLVGQITRLSTNLRWLLLISNFLTALGAIPLGYLARDILKSPTAALFLAAAYVLWLGSIEAAAFPLHPAAWQSTGYAFLFLCLFRNHRLGFVAALLFSLMCKEDTGAHLIFIGLYFGLVLKRKWSAVSTVVIGGLSLWLITGVLMPALNPYRRYIHNSYLPGKTSDVFDSISYFIFRPWTALKQFADSETKVVTTSLTAATTAFITVAHPAFWLLVLPFLAQRFLSRLEAPHTLTLHYSAPLSFVRFYSATASMACWFRGPKENQKIIFGSALILLCSLILTGAFGYHRQGSLMKRAFNVDPELYASTISFLERIPPSDSVLSTQFLLPPVSIRKQLDVLNPYTGQGFNWVVVPKSSDIDSNPLNFNDAINWGEHLKGEKQYKLVLETPVASIFQCVQDCTVTPKVYGKYRH